MAVFDRDRARRQAIDSLNVQNMLDSPLDIVREAGEKAISKNIRDQRRRFSQQQRDQLRERISERERGRRQMSPMGRGLTTAGTGRQTASRNLLSSPDTLPSLLGEM